MTADANVTIRALHTSEGIQQHSKIYAIANPASSNVISWEGLVTRYGSFSSSKSLEPKIQRPDAWGNEQEIQLRGKEKPDCGVPACEQGSSVHSTGSQVCTNRILYLRDHILRNKNLYSVCKNTGRGPVSSDSGKSVSDFLLPSSPMFVRSTEPPIRLIHV
jgi:hypothetical protein